ncbi:LLM class flavin-dependent oxidoreductase [Agromyces aurantiacus]|uniref:LLM class flavin-dependent oxidoreductase n=1 Tax=Agromyces aurantiacus TaxID=165814 RepID=A0ABV9R6G9_9MICO|nr:LLM class flavin-dependent oxidoreductase [Agromyces aurantiacus]MBM7504420.1 alkanesulfonate monooxygenase SsuD/methylene tetrahydromethanopterin reductase-like flavin-dependent oxidoreductase (luciferase family) [Agromyces aurantiacus]
MRFGLVILPQYDWPEAGRLWRQAEQLGFDHAWTYDHLSWRGLAGERWHATVPTLTAAAMVTERIRLGTFVASPNYRHPVPFAKDVATLDQVSGGRVVLGLGSGGTGFDAFVLGQGELTARERFERFREFTEALDVLLRHERGSGRGISYSGDWYSAVGARMVGEPDQEPRVPFLIAANGPRALRLAARLGSGWVTTGPQADTDAAWWSGVADLAARLDDACAAEGRDPAELDRVLSLDDDGRYSMASVGAFEDAVGRARDLGFTDVVTHRPREHGLYAGTEAVLEEVGSRLDALR